MNRGFLRHARGPEPDLAVPRCLGERGKSEVAAAHSLGTEEFSAPNINRQWRMQMNWDQVAGNWKQAKGKVKQQWGKLTDDDLTLIDGKRDELAGRLQERYGYAKDEAEKEIDTWAGRA
jgi:uncharacterized protein YjbJ (UPF0337 family)